MEQFLNLLNLFLILFENYRKKIKISQTILKNCVLTVEHVAVEINV